MNNSPTPRTDAVLGDDVPALCRQLERQITELRAALESAAKGLDAAHYVIDDHLGPCEAFFAVEDAIRAVREGLAKTEGHAQGGSEP